MRRRITIAAVLVATAMSAGSCRVGQSREIDISRDLSGLDLAYLQRQAEPVYDENGQPLPSQLGGTPFWFLPAISVAYRGSHADHLGPLDADADKDEPQSPISGYGHVNGSALALGALSYEYERATWNVDGALEAWQRNWGLGWGLLYQSRQAGDGERRTMISTTLLSGLFGYSEDEGGSYLHLLWIPIGVGGPSEADRGGA